jgi:hypothetical protein
MISRWWWRGGSSHAEARICAAAVEAGSEVVYQLTYKEVTRLRSDGLSHIPLDLVWRMAATQFLGGNLASWNYSSTTARPVTTLLALSLIRPPPQQPN